MGGYPSHSTSSSSPRFASARSVIAVVVRMGKSESNGSVGVKGNRPFLVVKYRRGSVIQGARILILSILHRLQEAGFVGSDL